MVRHAEEENKPCVWLQKNPPCLPNSHVPLSFTQLQWSGTNFCFSLFLCSSFSHLLLSICSSGVRLRAERASEAVRVLKQVHEASFEPPIRFEAAIGFVRTFQRYGVSSVHQTEAIDSGLSAETARKQTSLEVKIRGLFIIERKTKACRS